ncbi:carboxypeptidase-like regulatory domain-containing protein [uncultured Draconibacterium sp.]|uniref:carboxypeptidase-like regulatory domain-containing protein n=1 Tax=uncultured Draconibacterium sp. TaxID=1573823 RepID=UPI0032605F47
MSNRKTHIDKKIINRYLQDKMSDKERNAFEKEMQKDAFLADAVDGFMAHAATTSDTGLIEDRIKQKPKKTMPYFAAAASVLLLLTSGIIWMQLRQEEPAPKLSETRIEKNFKNKPGPAEQPTEPEIMVRKKATEAEQPKGKAAKPIQTEKATLPVAAERKDADDAGKPTPPITEAKALKSTPEKEVPKAKITAAPKPPEPNEITLEMSDKEENPELIAKPGAAAQKTREATQVHGTVVSADDRMPLPGVTLVEKGTDNGTISDIEGRFNLKLKNDSNPVIASFIGMETQEFNLTTDSAHIVALQANEVALNEVVVVGFGKQEKKAANITGSQVADSRETIEATPVCGMKEYNTYLKTKAILSANSDAKKVIVKLSFRLEKDGQITSFENLNKAEAHYFNQAKNMVKNGPKWTPRYQNNKKTASTVTLRIVFKNQSN